MRYTSDDHDCDHAESTRGQRRNIYLSDAFSEYQGFWLRQGEYWYDVIGKFVGGEYRAEDWGTDASRLWDAWMGDYQRLVQFPHRKAQMGQVPNVVFVLDEKAQGHQPKEVPIWFSLGRPRPDLVATPLRAVGANGANGAHIQAEFVDRGRYAKIRLVNGQRVQPEEAHLMSVVHTSDASRAPVAVVHVVRRGPLPADAGADHGEGRPASERGGYERGGGSAGSRFSRPETGNGDASDYRLLQLLREELAARPMVSIEAVQELFESRKQHDARLVQLEQSLASLTGAAKP